MNNLRVLLIDDDRVTRLTLKHYFDKNVAHFRSVESAESAISIMKDTPAWDVVISDYVLPGMDGGELLKKVKEIQPGLMTILITSYDPRDIDAVLQENDIDHFITKPVSLDSLHYALASIDPK
ncbi:MAG: response regulator [Desulfobacterales bacterium]|nr:response regulator [Desulfobacterales bacterium]